MKQTRGSIRRALLLSLLLPAAAACGGPDGGGGNGTAGNAASGSADGLTEFQLQHGIGPFTEEVSVDASDEALVTEGERNFQLKCEACHRMEERLVGPPLGQVMERRTPTFVANMIMNPEQMAKEHPEVRALLAEYPIIMPYQNVTEQEALAIVAYLQSLQP